LILNHEGTFTFIVFQCEMKADFFSLRGDRFSTIQMRSLKVVLVGDTKVGKSCILTRFVQDSFERSMPATIGAAFFTKVVSTSDANVRLQLWDTAGQEKFRSLAPMYYRAAAVAVVVYDITNRGTFESLPTWQKEISEKAPPNTQLVIIGNKIDLIDDRQVSTAEGEQSAKELGAKLFGETSAESGDGIDAIFTRIADMDPTEDDVYEAPHPQAPAPQEDSCIC
jgi:small GTP-binding protein